MGRGIFKRFFLILEYLERNSFEECVIIDSDVLLYLNVSEYEPFRHCKVAAETPFCCVILQCLKKETG